MTKRIMSIGAGPSQIYAITKAKSMGYEVVAIDINPESPGFKIADYPVKISTLDVEGAITTAKEYKIGGVMFPQTDHPMQTIAAIVEELSLPGISKETAYVTTNKGVMRDRLSECGVPVPAYQVVDSFDSFIKAVKNIGGKLICKPVDSSGSRGVCPFHSEDNNLQYIYNYSKQFSRSKKVIVEEYMVGPEVSVETFSLDGKVRVIAITDKVTTGEPHFVEIGHSIQSSLDLKIKEEIKEIAKKTVKAMGVDIGPTHIEMKITDNGPKIVELSARLAGATIGTRLIELATGIDAVANCVKTAMGEKTNLQPTLQKGAAVRYFGNQPGQFIEVSNVDEILSIPGVKEIVVNKRTGDVVEELTDNTKRYAYVIAQADTSTEAIEICRQAINLINLEIK